MTSTVNIQDSQVSINTICLDNMELPVSNINYQNTNSEHELYLHLEESTIIEQDVSTQSADSTVTNTTTPLIATTATQSVDSILTKTSGRGWLWGRGFRFNFN